MSSLLSCGVYGAQLGALIRQWIEKDDGELRNRAHVLLVEGNFVYAHDAFALVDGLNDEKVSCLVEILEMPGNVDEDLVRFFANTRMNR